jgi:hypothetical protein
MLTKIVSGVEVVLTAQEESDLRAEWAVNLAAQEAANAIDLEFKTKKSADIANLGSRAEMQAEAAAANSIPALRDLVAKLAEIVYSETNKTIE